MPTITVRELQRALARILDDAAESGEPVIVTRRGRPVGILHSTVGQDWEDIALALSPSVARALVEADADLREGRSIDADDVFAADPGGDPPGSLGAPVSEETIPVPGDWGPTQVIFGGAEWSDVSLAAGEWVVRFRVSEDGRSFIDQLQRYADDVAWEDATSRPRGRSRGRS
jgi:prevent-host-death family protein